ncbi:hypothetical protein X929_05630 [Petrotoga olearia DSM 13574]|uniref:Uncharacterized protein n=1 Tax=Petrotoga olearia DSM 13574 TaxID=1122955 RepID=A0A2K1P0C7_9BACT|nr:hypothetical protein X929_05630 [Petrotoga olearia DSM 13574]
MGIIWEYRHYGWVTRQRAAKALYENFNGGKLCFQ